MKFSLFMVGLSGLAMALVAIPFESLIMAFVGIMLIMIAMFWEM